MLRTVEPPTPHNLLISRRVVLSVYLLEVGGVSPFVKPPTGKSFRFVRACERARRGEAVWASERRFDCEARAVVRDFCCSSCGETMPGGLSTKNVDLTQVLPGFSRTTFVKPM